MIVRSDLSALSFVSHPFAAMGPVVVSSLLHILVQHVLLPLERQMLTARPGFEPQACLAPTRPGIYLFSVIDDTMQVRCTIAESLSPRCLCCRACIVALQPARLCLLHALNHTDKPCGHLPTG